MNRQSIEQDLLAWMAEPRWRDDDDRFARLALALFAAQFDACEPYAAYCRSLDRAPDTIRRWQEIPAVPTGAFKEFALRSFPEAETLHTFRTSGTSVERRGTLYLDTLAIYEASLLSSLRRLFLTDLCGRSPRMRFLAPAASDQPDSSLSHMFETLLRVEGDPEDSAFDWRDGQIDRAALEAALSRARMAEAPVVIAGTSFAFVHLLDGLAGRDGEGGEGGEGGAMDWPVDSRLPLPPGSRVMETGGFKGRSREIPRDVLRVAIARCFALDERSVINQYGMTELGSQFYDSTLVDRDGPRRKLVPPWVRVRFVDPEAGREVEEGEVGLVVIHDLANTGSVAAIQTADLGRAIVDDRGQRIGFDVLGRGEGAEARGCSIAADAMLAAGGGEGE